MVELSHLFIGAGSGKTAAVRMLHCNKPKAYMKFVVIHKHSDAPAAKAKIDTHVAKQTQRGNLLRSWMGKRSHGYLAQAPNLAALASVVGGHPLAHSGVTKVVPFNPALLKQHGPQIKALLAARAAAAR